MTAPISLAANRPDGQDAKAFWKHMVGLALIEMKERGWTAGRIIDADWRENMLRLTIGPGHGKVTAEAVAAFIREKRSRR